MLYTYPHYYRKFQCIASECEDTCCAGWEIMIDDKALEKYKKAKGPVGNRLKNSINWKEGSFLQYHHRCAFLNDENLCDLYIEMGPDSLCRTCRMYPRHVEEFEGSREYSLCLSCMEAAKIILGCEEKVQFLTKEDEKDETYDDFDFFLYTKLMDARDLVFQILQDRSLDVKLRMAEVLALAHDLQRRVRDNVLYQTDALFEKYNSSRRDDYFKEKLAGIKGYSRYEAVKEIIALLEEMEDVYKRQESVYLYSLQVLPELRNRHLGTAFLSALLPRLAKKGFKSIKLQVSSENLPAMALYKKTGFYITQTLSFYEY